MKRPILFLLIPLSTVALVKATNNGSKDDARESVAVVNKLFDAMRAKDTDAIRALFAAEGQLVATDRRSGDPSRRVFTANAFAELIAGAQGVLKEPMYRPEVRVAGDLDPRAWREGRDPQLERAVEVVMEALRKNPPPKAKKPVYPNYQRNHIQ